MRVAGGERLVDHRLEGNRTVTRHGTRRQRPVAEHVVTQLDHHRAGQCPLHQGGEVRFCPAVEQVDADSHAGHLGKLDGVPQRVRDVDVGVEARGVLDRESHPRLPRGVRTRLHRSAESIGCLLPGQFAPTTGQHVDRACADGGGGVDHPVETVRRFEQMEHRLNRVTLFGNHFR